MMTMIPPVVAILLATVIFVRAVCVCYSTTPANHRHPLMFLGFGYSYVLLGAGAVFSAIEILGADVGQIPLWLILIGSAGLIVFDRRRQQCWAITNCPAEQQELGR